MSDVDDKIAAAYDAYKVDVKLNTSAAIKTMVDKGKISCEMRAAAMRLYIEKLDIEKRAAQETKLKTLLPALALTDLKDFVFDDAPDGGLVIKEKSGVVHG